MTPRADRLELAVPSGLVARLERALRPFDADGRTIAFAESCTAGLAAAAVSGVKGLGHVLDCAWVTYSDGAKSRLLGVPSPMIEQYGAVSEQVARLMAEGALGRSPADVAVAITGFAGPAGPADEEGLVHFAMAASGAVTRHREEHFGTIGQDAVRLKAIGVVAELLASAPNGDWGNGSGSATGTGG